ncbi:hypothetical protein [Methylocella tundrae]|uniref:hypothetical protein n=1 Tax=Methylocella tundrae TaxID=227605 RepID=UPI00157B5A4B|nr:hypothetical protein [Methylocella tundrae]
MATAFWRPTHANTFSMGRLQLEELCSILLKPANGNVNDALIRLADADPAKSGWA